MEGDEEKPKVEVGEATLNTSSVATSMTLAILCYNEMKDKYVALAVFFLALTFKIVFIQVAINNRKNKA